MAVQAQYPSNVLLVNSNVQDGHDYSLHPHPGGFLLDQTHILLNNGAYANSRKRGREAEETRSFNNIIGPSPVNVLSLQSPPQLIELSQLHNPQPGSNVLSTGLQLFDHRPSMFSLLSEDLALHAKQQKEEIDQFLLAQGELLRRTLVERRQRHYRALLSAAEDMLARKQKEKEAETEKARRRNFELQARAAQLGVEAQTWLAKARAQEATVMSLRAHLQQAMIVGHDSGAVRADVSEVQGAEDAESMYVDPGRVGQTEPSCKACGKRAARVVLLPCRHLSLCSECGNVAQNCPVCFCARSSSVEVLLS